MTTVLLVGDLHIQSSTLKEFHIFKKEFFECVRQKRPDFINILGDILHTHQIIHVTPLKEAVDFLVELSSICLEFGGKVGLLIGNHDRINNSEFCTDVHAFTSLKKLISNLLIVDDTISVAVGKYKFVCVPYVPPGRFREALLRVNDYRNHDCVFAHQECKGAQMGAIVSVVGDEWDDIYDPPCYSGHIHDSQKIGSKWTYVGTPYMTNFGEKNDKSIMLLEFSSDHITEKRIEFSISNNKKKLHWTVDDIVSKKSISSADDKLEIKIVVSGDASDRKSTIGNSWYRALKKKYNISYRVKRQNRPVVNDVQYILCSFDELMHDKLKDEPRLLELHRIIMMST
jgi:DNA repair exonuclease SbcCD nuclease subunit